MVALPSCHGRTFSWEQFEHFVRSAYSRKTVSKDARGRVSLLRRCQVGGHARQEARRLARRLRKRWKAKQQAGGAGGILAAIRACESGNDYTKNTGNGFWGAYQFTLGTWAANGGTGRPDLASPAEQDRVAANLLAKVGVHTPASWPHCP